MVYEYILGCRNVAYILKVYVTLNLKSDLNHPKQRLFHCPTLLYLEFIKYV